MPDAAYSDTYDVAIIGGGPAGLSAAIWLARYLRRVVVIDAGDPRNWEAREMHGYLGFDGIAPTELRRRGREESRKFGAELIDATATRPRRASTASTASTTTCSASLSNPTERSPLHVFFLQLAYATCGPKYLAWNAATVQPRTCVRIATATRPAARRPWS